MDISIGPTPTIDIVWTTLRCISIGPSPTIDIFSMYYPPILIIFIQPSELFSQELSHALTLIVLGCPSAYGMHDANSISIL